MSSSGKAEKGSRSGTTTFTPTDTSKAITFTIPMVTAVYEVVLQPARAVWSSLSVADKATSGFTINLTNAPAADLIVSYNALET